MQKDFKVPYFGIGSIWGEEELDVVKHTIFSSNTLSCGEQLELFEREFADYVGCKHALTVSSGTEALNFATYLVGLKSGDEVIVTPFSYQASISSLLTLPVKVKFCDIDTNTLCADPESIKTLITEKTKAIYLTHIGGFMADMEPILTLANEYGLIIVEDCAHAHGSLYRGKKAGSFGHIGCYSFQSSKNMTTLGEGGMITFNNDKWASVIRNIRGIEPDADFILRDGISFGGFKKPKYNINMHEKNAFTHECLAIHHPGTCSPMCEPAAAVGRVQLTKLEGFNERRREIAKKINDGLMDLPQIRIQKVPDHNVCNYHLFAFFINSGYGIGRDQLVSIIQEQGVEVVLRYFPLHLLPEWRYHGHEYGECPQTEHIWFHELVNLPIYPSLSDEQVEYMISTVRNAVIKLSI